MSCDNNACKKAAAMAESFHLNNEVNRTVLNGLQAIIERLLREKGFAEFQHKKEIDKLKERIRELEDVKS